MPKLTKTLIDSTKAPEEGDLWLWCDQMPGFGVRVQASGRKTYVCRYRTAAGTQRKMKIARVCDMHPDKARERAREIFAAAATGADPMQERRDDRDSPTMRDLERRYTAEWAKPFKKPNSQMVDARVWRLYVLPEMGSKKVKDVTRADVLRLVGSLSEKQATGNQCIALLSKAFALCEDWGWRPINSNPCRRMHRYKLRQRMLVLKPDQLAKLDTALTELEQEASIPPSFSRLIRLLQLTGCRKMEILGARRDWVDDEEKRLFLPDSKVGQRQIRLPDVAMGMLGETTGEWLVPNRAGSGHLGNVYRMWRRVKERAGLPESLRLHDLRHTVGSLGHRAGLSQKQIQALLGHKQISTTAIYLHNVEGEDGLIANTAADVITRAWSAPA